MKRYMIMTFDKDGEYYGYKAKIGFEKVREISQGAERVGRLTIIMQEAFKAPVIIKWRKMEIPTETALLGVATDRNSERVEFRLNKIYQGFDLSTKVFFVDTLNENGSIFDTAQPLILEDGDTIRLQWIVGPLPASVNGTVSVRLRAIGDNFVWQTETGKFKLAETFVTTDPPDPPGMTYFNEIILQAQSIYRSTVESEGRAEDHATAAAQSEAAASQYAQMAGNAADRAAFSAQNAPRVNPDTRTWEVYDGASGRFVDTGVLAEGQDGNSFAVLAVYDTYGDLVAEHPTGGPGDAYFVLEPERTVYIWDVEVEAWADVGDLQGPPGERGEDGAAATARIVETVTGLPGTQALIEELPDSTPQNRKWRVTIPQGKDGAQATLPINGIMPGDDGYALRLQDIPAQEDSYTEGNLVAFDADGVAVDSGIHHSPIVRTLDAGEIVEPVTIDADRLQGKTIKQIVDGISASDIKTDSEGVSVQDALDRHSAQMDMQSEKIPTASNPLDIPSGGTGGTTAAEAKANLGMGDLIWSGSVTSGSIVIPRVYDYKLYIIATSSANVHFIGVRTADIINAFGLNVASSGNASNTFRLSISGTTASITGNQYMTHTASASNGALNTTGRTITEIYGIV